MTTKIAILLDNRAISENRGKEVSLTHVLDMFVVWFSLCGLALQNKPQRLTNINFLLYHIGIPGSVIVYSADKSWIFDF